MWTARPETAAGALRRDAAWMPVLDGPGTVPSGTIVHPPPFGV